MDRLLVETTVDGMLVDKFDRLSTFVLVISIVSIFERQLFNHPIEVILSIM
jgi:hypothetical protein